MPSEYLGFQKWAVGAFILPFEVSIIVCTILTVLMLFLTREISMYKFRTVAIVCILLPVTGMVVLLASVGICFAGASVISPNVILMIPIISIGIFFLMTRFILSKILRYMDNKEILFLSILIALLGNPVMLFVWDLYGEIGQILPLIYKQ